MIYEYFRATGAYEAVQCLSDLFNIRLQNDDVHHVVSVMIEHLETDATRGEKDNRPLLYQKRRYRLTEINHSMVQASEEQVFLEKEAEMRADISSRESARTRHVVIGTLMCVSISSLNQDANMAKNVDSNTLRLMGSPVQSRRKVV